VAFQRQKSRRLAHPFVIHLGNLTNADVFRDTVGFESPVVNLVLVFCCNRTAYVVHLKLFISDHDVSNCFISSFLIALKL